jgi:hypothetical protein
VKLCFLWPPHRTACLTVQRSFAAALQTPYVLAKGYYLLKTFSTALLTSEVKEKSTQGMEETVSLASNWQWPAKDSSGQGVMESEKTSGMNGSGPPINLLLLLPFFQCFQPFLSPQITPLLVTALVLQPKSGDQTPIYLNSPLPSEKWGASILLEKRPPCYILLQDCQSVKSRSALSPCACCKGWHAWWPLTWHIFVG